MVTVSYSDPAAPQGASPVKPRRRFLALKIIGGVIALAVLVLGGAAVIDQLNGQETYGAGAQAGGAGKPNILDAAAFSTALSAAAAGKDSAAFTALFAPALQADAARYFANLRAMDVDHVLAVLGTESAADLAAPSFDASLRIGLHIEGVDGDEVLPVEPMPGMAAEAARTPSTDYTVTVSRTDGVGGLIEAWAPVAAPAPWDVQELASVRSGNVVLATGAGNEALLERFQPATQAAADYVSTVFGAVDEALGPDSGLDNPGFLVFVEPDDALYASYFTVNRSAGPVSESAGYAVSAPSASGDSAGSRVVIRPTDEAAFASTAVHEFVHVMYSSGPNRSFLDAGQIDPGVAWVAEGVAEWLQTLYGDPDFTGATRDAVRAAVADGFFADRPPTHDELYSQAQYGYPLSASVFQWISETHGEAAAFDAASTTIRSGIDELFFNLPPIDDGDPQAAWAAWVRAL